MPVLSRFRLLRSVRGRLLLLVAAVVLPAVVLAIAMILKAHHDERMAVERRLQETARALSLVVDRQLGQAEAVLRTLAASPALAEQDFEAFHRQARAALAGFPGWMGVVGADGQQFMNTAREFGAPLSRVPMLDGMGEAISHGRIYVSNLAPSTIRDGPVVLVALPYSGPASDVAMLLMVLPPESLSNVLADQEVPTSWVAAIVDREGFLVARSRRAEDFVGGPATERARAYLRAADSGAFTNRTLDGVLNLTGFNRSSDSGWTVVIGGPLSELLAPTASLLGLLAAAIFGLIAIGLAMSAWVGRGLIRAMDNLVNDATAVGRGDVPVGKEPAIEEAALVAHALRDSALQLKTREGELQRLNETLEARVQEASERLVAATKLEAVGRLTGGVAHDFNNLLAAIRINLDLTLRHFPHERTLKYVEAACESTDRGAKLVAQLLAFARKQRLVPEPIDVNDIARSMADMLRRTLTGAIELRLALAPGLAPAHADRTQLELMIMNLVINARDAMQSGGTITVETGRALVDDDPARPEGPPSGEYIFITISDTGAGMAPELLERVFEPFFTTKQTGKGSGLGLPQVLGIVKQLGGGLRIDSRPGRGTAVQILLPPAAPEAVLPAAPREAVAPVTGLDGLCCLLVDDDPAVRSATQALLEAAGCTVAAGADAKAALTLLEAGFAPDVALLDYAMPEMNGLDLASRLAADYPRLPVVLMTGYADSTALEACWQGPLLAKPFNQERLKAVLAGAAAPAELR